MKSVADGFVLCLAVAAALTLSSAAIARDKSDVIVLLNGDHITGEIKELEYGQLTVKTDSLGTVEIRWLDIARIESRQTFYVDSTDNKRHTGAIKPATDTGHILIASAPENVDFSVKQVARIGQLEGEFRDRFSGSMSFGIDYTSSSNVAESSLDFSTVYQSGKLTTTFEADANSTTTSDQGTLYDYALGVNFQYLRPNDNFWLGMTSFESNQQQGIDGRLVVGAGPGRYLIRKPEAELAAFGGVALVQEWASSSGSDAQSVEGFAGLQWKVFKLHDPETTLTTSLVLFPSLSETGRVRADLDISLRHEIIKDLYFELSLDGAYDNQPPVADAENTDYQVTTSLGYKF
ncbi:MAG: DUF481 domain-containing protein [Burkholderiales bacterium]